MSHSYQQTMGTREKLVYMANQIGLFFKAMPHEEAVEGTAKHINDFWDPRMRRQLFEIIEAGGKGLDPLVLEASARVRRPSDELT
jgi:formate dehydrogenase subunit delta